MVGHVGMGGGGGKGVVPEAPLLHPVGGPRDMRYLSGRPRFGEFQEPPGESHLGGGSPLYSPLVFRCPCKCRIRRNGENTGSWCHDEEWRAGGGGG